MADNIAVQPGVDAGRVDVLTDEQGGVHIPVYEDLNLAVPQGKIATIGSVNKFGAAPDGVQTTATDIWDRADATPTQQIWVAPPSEAAQHNIVSTSGVDISTVSAGARVLRIWGLTSWDTKEVFEDINMNGTTDVLTVNSYVIIHRMSVISYGTIGVNVGIITATVIASIRVTAQINIGQGQTQMAIYGFPSIQTAYMSNWYASIHKSKTETMRLNLMLCADPVNSPSLFIVKEIRGLVSTGTSSDTWKKEPDTKFVGPGILKIQAIASAADIDAGGGFDLKLVDN